MQFQAEMNGTHWVCKALPLPDNKRNFQDPLKLDSKAQDQGPKTIQGKSYEGWHWFDSIAGIIHGRQQWYVDQSGAAPVPFENIEAHAVRRRRDCRVHGRVELLGAGGVA